MLLRFADSNFGLVWSLGGLGGILGLKEDDGYRDALHTRRSDRSARLKIDAAVGNGQINVSVCLGDLNGDEVIDISDVQAVAGRAGQTLGDPNFVPDFDLNNDSVLDESDVTAVTSRLYESCP